MISFGFRQDRRNCPHQPLPEPPPKFPSQFPAPRKSQHSAGAHRPTTTPKSCPPARQLTSTQSSQPSNHGSTKSSGSFTIFTIIPISTHQIITFKMALTAIPVERNLSYIFTMFTNMARNASPTCGRPISRTRLNVLPILMWLPVRDASGAPRTRHLSPRRKTA